MLSIYILHSSIVLWTVMDTGGNALSVSVQYCSISAVWVRYECMILHMASAPSVALSVAPCGKFCSNLRPGGAYGAL
jgi:hypothetical protein